MNNAANVEYFYTKCNSLLGTNYTSDDWGGDENKDKSINIEWIIAAVNKVYQEIHQSKNGCNLLLSSKFNEGNSKIAVNEDVVNSVVQYLTNLNKICDNDCACYKDLNCNCVCASHCNCKTASTKTCGNCNNCSGSDCNCTGNYQCNCNCACECGSNSECVCDCEPYDCNCTQTLNCNFGAARPMTQNCGTACNCNCDCDCAVSACACGGGSGNGVCISACTTCGGVSTGDCGTCGHCTNCQANVCLGNANCPGTNCGAGTCGQCGPCCFKKGSLITMSNGTMKRIDEIIPGEKVKTYIGEDEVLLVTEYVNTIYELILNDNTKIEVAGGHPFPMRDSGFGSIEPSKLPVMSKLISSKKLKVGDYIYPDKKILGIKNTEIKENLFNLVLKSELVYYVNDTPVMTHNPFFLVFYCLLSSETDSRFDGKFKEIRELLSEKTKNKLKERVIYIVSKINLKDYTKNGNLNFDITNLSKICLKIMNSEDTSEILCLVNKLIDYELNI
ncbi:MAG: hypothetical protein FWC19_06785 [Treponema sp.]|nr:hypothetical protein [Treponema sp.]MCL2272491.1 hypothetical protein [Treponema sp.]